MRGLAALSVLVCHFTLYGTTAEVASGWWALRQGALAGWIGVDLFFVLSGFLITGILMDIRQNAGGLRAFYVNRALRIFPLYGVVVVVTAVLLPAIFRHHADFLDLAERKWWYFTYTINVLIARQGWPEHGALAHFWSLAVEEQFYLVWPAVVLLCTRARLIGICLAVLLLAPLQRLLLHHVGYATAAYVLTSTRMDALAAGALVALLARSSTGLTAYRFAARRVCAISVAAWVAIVWVGGQDPEGFLMGTVGYSVLAFAFAAALVMLLTDDRSPAARLLSRGAFRWLGQHSYALYVLHHILIFLLLPGIAAAIAGQGHQLAAFARPAAVAMVAMLTFVLASLSWRFIEAPALSRKRRYAHTAEWQSVDMAARANAHVTSVHDR